MVNRSIQPNVKNTEKIAFVQPKKVHLDGGVDLFFLNKVPDETVRMELHFQAGQIEGNINVANFVNALLLAGTNNKTSEQIHEELDYLGAYIDHEISMEAAFVNLYCLRSNFEKALAILMDAIKNAHFPSEEIDDMLKEKKQRFLVSLEKVNYLARKAFQKHFFCSNQHYGRDLHASDFDNAERDELRAFHERCYLNGLKKVVLVGDLNENQVQTLKKEVQSFGQHVNTVCEKAFQNDQKHIHLEKKDALQTAIRLGWPMFNKKNKDYFAFQVLQTILGDYFGSRLMSNIREDKGYTYGIGCALVELKETGYFIIATEVGKEVAEATIKEIRYEVERLQNELIPQEELDLVKNYMLGQLLKSADGPNATMDLFLGVEQHQLELDFYNDFIQKILTVQAEELRELAKMYLNWDKITLITAGERN